MSTIARGNASESAVLNAFVQRGFTVLEPFGGGHALDLVVLVDDEFVRVQTKTAWEERGCLIFNAYSTDHGHGPRSYEGRADLFGVFHPGTQSVYLVPVHQVGPSNGRLRLEPTRNGQRKRIRYAADFQLDSWTDSRFADLAASIRAHHA